MNLYRISDKIVFNTLNNTHMRIILFLIALTLVNCSQYSKKNINESSVDYFVSKNSNELNFPFSDASIINDIIYVSGQVGTIAGTRELIDGGIGNETSQALKNINSILESLGSSSDKIKPNSFKYSSMFLLHTT